MSTRPGTRFISKLARSIGIHVYIDQLNYPKRRAHRSTYEKKMSHVSVVRIYTMVNVMGNSLDSLVEIDKRLKEMPRQALFPIVVISRR